MNYRENWSIFHININLFFNTNFKPAMTILTKCYLKGSIGDELIQMDCGVGTAHTNTGSI